MLANSANMGKGSLYARFEEQGHAITRVREEICGCRLGMRSGLSIPDGVPVIDVLHTGIDQRAYLRGHQLHHARTSRRDHNSRWRTERRCDEVEVGHAERT